MRRIAVGVVVERRKAQSRLDRFHLEAGDGAGRACRRRRRGPCCRRTATARRSTPAPAEIALYRTETANYRDNLATGAPMLWVALRPTGVEPPYEIFAVTADPAEGEALTEVGQRSGRRGADAGARCAKRSRRSSPSIMSSGRSSSASATAPIRRRWHAAHRYRRSETNERAGQFHRALVAPQARRRRSMPRRNRPTKDARWSQPPATSGAADCGRAEARASRVAPAARSGASEPPEPPFDLTKLPPIESITAETDIRAFLAPGVPAESDPCGASSRLGRRSQDPGFRRARRLRLGLQYAGRDRRLRAAGDDR